MNSRKVTSETRRGFPATKARSQQPLRILIVDVTSPSWTNTSSVLSEALENTLCLACSLAGPCRVPLLSLYVVQNQQECLLPFMITILTSQSGKEMVKQLEKKLKDVDLVSLRRLQIVEVLKRDFLEPEGAEQSMPAEEPGSDDIAILGMDIDVQTVEDNVISLEMLFKTWLHDYGTDREQLHLLLPSGGFSHAAAAKSSLMCLKCDLQERLLDPALFSGAADGTMRTADMNSLCQMAAWPATALHKLRVVKALKSEGVCESVLYGLPFIIKPTSCWQLDWDELETNQHSFHALCHSLLSALNSLEVEVTYNPLHLKNNLYKYLKNMLHRPMHRQQAQPRDQRPERHQPKQLSEGFVASAQASSYAPAGSCTVTTSCSWSPSTALFSQPTAAWTRSFRHICTCGAVLRASMVGTFHQG
ncbi:meiosis 1 arrest protein isoform X3 [Apteryx mantelli]|uniref:Meiosis 1 arrest protein isoform X3 n=1 Tax=Apteryx mantelli TaxID=2696672 RepID=A0A8B7IRT7_9AVES|nr:PREDICTED: meiosis 1 arrest protein isoform X3 [Apteryx mantelli mantelli]